MMIYEQWNTCDICGHRTTDDICEKCQCSECGALLDEEGICLGCSWEYIDMRKAYGPIDLGF